MKYGELYTLGDHLLLCGDCTNIQDLQRLLSITGPMDAIVSDPPYGMINAQWDSKPNLDFIKHLAPLMKPTATAIFFCGLPYGFALHQAMLYAGWTWRFDCVWAKNSAGFQCSKHRPLAKHEMLFAYARKGAEIRSLTFNGYEAGEPGEAWADKHDKASWSNDVYGNRNFATRKGRIDGQRWITSLLPGVRKLNLPLAERTIHPTQKPEPILCKLIKLLTNEGETVFDGFLGSGTTLLACEKVGRKCVAIEREKEYCTMAIERWERLTGGKAELWQEHSA